MRWGLRRRAEARHDVPDLASQPPARPTVSDWRRLPPLGLTVAGQPVLVGATLGSPVVSGTRQLLARSYKEGERADPEPAGAGAEAFTGRVAGLVVPSATPAADSRPDAGPEPRRNAQPQPDGGSELPPTVRLRPAARTEAAEQRPVLVKAVDEFVGEPQPADTPYASSAWLRMIQAYRLLPADADAVVPESLPGLSQSGKPDGGTVTTWSSSVTFAPPRAAQAQAQAGAGPAAERPRKLSLAESRRLGVGPPLRHAPGDADDDGAATIAGDQYDPAEGPGEPDADSLELSRRDEFRPPEGPAGLADAVSSPAARVTDLVQGPRARPEHLGLGFPEPGGDDPAEDQLPGSPREHTAPGDNASRGSSERPQAPARVPAGRSPQHPHPAQLASGQLPPAKPTPAKLGPAKPTPAKPTPAKLVQATGSPQHPALLFPAIDPPGSPGSEVSGVTDGGQGATASVTAVPGAPAVVVPVYRPAPAAPSATATPGAAAAVRPSAGVAAEPLVHRSPSAQPVVTEAPPAPVPAPPVVAPEPPDVTVAAPAPPAFQALPPTPGAWQSPPLTGTDTANHPGWPSAVPSISEPAGQTEVTAVPYDLADTLRRLHGVDVSDVAVSRGPDAALRARALGARAFTSGGEVVLPAEEGPIERPQTRALLAHELTHAAQQRALGSSLPAEDSGYGAELEAQAAAVERRVLGHDVGVGPVPPQPLRHAWPVSTATWSPSAGPVANAPVQRQLGDSAEASLSGNTPDFVALPPPGSGGAQAQAVASAAGSEADGDGAEGSSGKRLLDLNDDKAVSEFITGIPENSEFISGMYENSEFISGMYENSDFISGVYRKVHARLRRELLVGRERSGLLSDFR